MKKVLCYVVAEGNRMGNKLANFNTPTTSWKVIGTYAKVNDEYLLKDFDYEVIRKDLEIGIDYKGKKVFNGEEGDFIQYIESEFSCL